MRSGTSKVGSDLEKSAEKVNETGFEEAFELTGHTINSGALSTVYLLQGHGRFNHTVLLTSGLIMLNVSMESVGMSYVIPAAECELELKSHHKGLVTAAAFIGIIATSFLWGYLGDRFGRRAVMLPAMIASSAFSIASSFSTNVWMLLVLRILTGCLVSASSATVYAYLGEMHTNSRRAAAIAWGSVFISFSFIILPGLAWLIIPGKWSFMISTLKIEPWRAFIWSWCLPGLLAAGILMVLPESPRFLLSAKGPEKALPVLAKMYAWNHGGSMQNFPRSIRKEIEDTEAADRLLSRDEVTPEANDTNTDNQVHLTSGDGVGRHLEFIVNFDHSFVIWEFLFDFWEYFSLNQLSQGNNHMILVKVEKIVTGSSGNNTSSGFIGALKNISFLFRPPLLRCVFISHISMFAVFMLSSGLYVWVPDILNNILQNTSEKSATICDIIHEKFKKSNNITLIEVGQACKSEVSVAIFPISMAMGLVFAVTYLAIGVFINKIGRKTLYCGIMFVCGVATVAAVFVPQGVATVALLILALCAGCAASILAAIAVDVFPTCLRAMAICVMYMVGRAGAAVGSYLLGATLDTHCQMSLSFLGVFTAGSIILMLFWPQPEKVRDEMERRGLTY